jgi:hypothetical protein
MKTISIQKMYQNNDIDYRLRNAIHSVGFHSLIVEANLKVSIINPTQIELVYGNDYCLKTALNSMRSRFDAKVTVTGNVLSITQAQEAEPTDTESDKPHTIGEIGENAAVMDFVEGKTTYEPTDTEAAADVEDTEHKPKKTKK